VDVASVHKDNFRNGISQVAHIDPNKTVISISLRFHVTFAAVDRHDASYFSIIQIPHA